MATDKVQAVTYITAAEHKALRLMAAELGVSFAEILRRIIRKELETQS